MRLSGLKILVFCLCLLVAFSASAEELSFSMNGFNSCKQRSATPFNNQYSEFTFDTTSKIFSYEAKFSTEGGMPLPDLLHFIIVPQDQSPAYAGRYIDVFIDAKNINNPIVSGYVFNGIVPTTGVDGRLNNVCNSGFVYSFTDRDPKDAITVADPLFSTLVPATASVVELKNVFDDSLNGNTYRTFELVLNGNLIQKNSANYCKDIFYQNAPSCVFDGLTVKTSPDKAGFFWFASAGGNISYYTEGTNTGYIGSLTGLSHCSACFNQSVATNRSPSCDSISYSNQTGAPGLKTSVAIKLFDKEANPLQVNVQGLPSGASTDPAIGQSLIPNSTNGFGVVNLNWTPRASQAGDYIMTLVATQNYGENKKSATCNMSLKINSLGDFVGSCTAANFSANKNTLEENAFFIKSQGNKLYKLLSSIKGASKREAAILKEINSAYTQISLKSANGALAQIPASGYRGSCPSYCPQDTNITLARISAKSLMLSMRVNAVKIGRQAVRKLKKARKLKEVKTGNSIIAKLNLTEANSQTILTDNIPAELYLCEF